MWSAPAGRLRGECCGEEDLDEHERDRQEEEPRDGGEGERSSVLHHGLETPSPPRMFHPPTIERLFYHDRSDGLCRAALSLALLVPRRGIGTRRAGRARRRARPVRARRHGPPGTLWSRPVLDGRTSGRAPSSRRRGDRAARSGGPGSRGRRRSCQTPATLSTTGPRSRCGRGPPGSAAPGTRSPAGSPRPCEGGPPRGRRGAARTAPGAHRAGRRRLEEPLPARLPGEPGRDQGGAPVQPGSARRARRGRGRAVGLPRGRDRPAPSCRRPGGGTGGRRGIWTRVRRRVLPRAGASPAPRRRLARGPDRGAGRRGRAAGRRHERRPLRSSRGARAGRRARRDPPWPQPRDARRSAPPRRRIEPQGRGGAGVPAPSPRCARRASRARLGRGHPDVRRSGGIVLGRAVVRALPVPRLRRARGRDAVLPPRPAVLGGCPAALPPDDLGGRQAGSPTSST